MKGGGCEKGAEDAEYAEYAVYAEYAEYAEEGAEGADDSDADSIGRLTLVGGKVSLTPCAEENFRVVSHLRTTVLVACNKQ